MVLSKTRITKALIRLRGCAGWSAPVLFATPRRQVFSRQGPANLDQQISTLYTFGSLMHSLFPKDNGSKNTFDFHTAADRECVAAIERHPALHLSADFIFLSLGMHDLSGILKP